MDANTSAVRFHNITGYCQTKSKAIVVQQVLLRFVRGACEGGKFQKSNNATVDDPNLTRDTFAAVNDSIV